MNPQKILKFVDMKMPYGKYRGVALIDLPEHYVLWHIKNVKTDRPIDNVFLELWDLKVNGLETMVKKLASEIKKPS